MKQVVKAEVRILKMDSRVCHQSSCDFICMMSSLAICVCWVYSDSCLGRGQHIPFGIQCPLPGPISHC